MYQESMTCKYTISLFFNNFYNKRYIHMMHAIRWFSYLYFEFLIRGLRLHECYRVLIFFKKSLKFRVLKITK